MAEKELEDEYFSRCQRGVHQVGSRILQDTLKNFVTCNDLDTKVKSYNWDPKTKITKEENALISNAAKDGYGKFDITLCYKLLRNLCMKILAITPSNGWGKDPQNIQTAWGDDVERIRSLRNTIAHHDSQSLTKGEYKTIWDELKDIANRLQSRGINSGRDYADDLKQLEDKREWKAIDSISGMYQI
ncbi:hypothetical protein FSP39_019744 [Pinctada imbricata]|uniref:DZIP3-like HEPN domain-containing protein n=1 Tax=Pinctada imbricata TaxID=66713 RepID=A0AA88Y5V1_PINIB|nr:hypothetical protein FSP39_019744 [Pinctada imbricata]